MTSRLPKRFSASWMIPFSERRHRHFCSHKVHFDDTFVRIFVRFWDAKMPFCVLRRSVVVILPLVEVTIALIKSIFYRY